MENKTITNEEFSNMRKNFDSTSGEVLAYLIDNDPNKKNQKTYNIILNKYFTCYEREIHMHGSWYEPTGTFNVSGKVPTSLFAKMSEIRDKLRAEEKQKKIDEDLKKDPEAKAIYESLEL